MIKKVVSLVLCATMFAISIPVFASNESPLISDAEIKAKNNTEVIEKYMAQHGTSVLSELKKEKKHLESLSKSETDVEEKTKLTNLIKNYDTMIVEYKAYQDSEKGTSGSVTTMGVNHPVLSPAVSAIVSYFVSKKYYLSAELLTYAKNTSTGGTYVPYYEYQMNNTTEYKRLVSSIRSSGKTSGSSSGEFKKSGAVVDYDLYYAVHLYSYSYNSGKLTITDPYDFAVTKNYEGLAGTAVNTMYMAQTLGVIVPYTVKVTKYY